MVQLYVLRLVRYPSLFDYALRLNVLLVSTVWSGLVWSSTVEAGIVVLFAPYGVLHLILLFVPLVASRFSWQVKQPMDMAKVVIKLLTGRYKDEGGMVADLRLMIDNCRR